MIPTITHLTKKDILDTEIIKSFIINNINDQVQNQQQNNNQSL